MLNRVISDIYQLRRVHSVLPDAVLGDTLKNKLLRLSLQPSLQQLKLAQQQHYGDNAESTSPQSSASPAASTSGSAGRRGRGSDGNFDFHGGAAFTPLPTAIEPAALCSLLDCLAYFHLGTSAVAKEAVQLVQLTAPTMSVPQLCTTLAACCALGAQQDITATALPLLSTALNHYRSTPPTGAGGSSPERQPLMFSHGASVVLLIEALQKAGVREKEVWHLLAEHCLRYLESLDGRQLTTVVGALCAEGIDDYPDFFVAAERHITSQPSGYLSTDLLQQVVQCYKELRQPVVSLLAVMNAAPLHAESLERSISAAATVAALSNAQGGGGASAYHSSSGASANVSRFDATSDAVSSASLQHSLQVFESAAVSALTTADAQSVMEVLRKCELRRVMTARVMNTALSRLVELYYPALMCDDDSAVRAGDTPSVPAHGAGEKSRHLPLELHRLSQCLLIALEFNDATLLATSTPQISNAASSAAAAGKSGDLPLISVLLDAIGEELNHWYHPRLLQTVPYAMKLLPPSAQPRIFFKALVGHLRRSSDLSSHEGPAALRLLVEALLTLRQFGGEATLINYMPAVTVAVLNAPRREQLELTAMMAHMPSAAKELVPGVYRQWGSQKRWLRTITEDEVSYALQVMARSGQRDSQLLHAVVAFVQAQRGQLPPQRVVEYLHQLARLGVRDLELFTHTAEHLMRRAVESSPAALQGGAARGGGGRQPSDLHGVAPSSSSSHAAGAGAAASSSSSSPTPSSTFAAARHQQWQITTVHDLALLLYTFTFVLRDSIRVTQQIIARLKMCSSAAAPRDISLALYSFVKLRVIRHDEVTAQLCERAAATLPDFTASELASMWSSLRCLHHPHPKLHRRTLELLCAASPSPLDTKEEMALAAVRKDTVAARAKWRFTDADCLSLGSALLLTEAAPLNLHHPLVLRRDASASTGSEAGAPPAVVSSHTAHDTIIDPLPPAFERQYVDVCRRLLPSATGQRLSLILCSLSRCATLPHLSLDAWETVLKLVDTHAEALSTGRLGDAVGMAQLEVLGALRLLHPHVADADALAAADAVRVESSKWSTPYCPPALWAVLRPRWRELSRSAAVQARPSLVAVVMDVKGEDGGDVQPAESAKARSLRKPLVRRGRKA